MGRGGIIGAFAALAGSIRSILEILDKFRVSSKKRLETQIFYIGATAQTPLKHFTYLLPVTSCLKTFHLLFLTSHLIRMRDRL